MRSLSLVAVTLLAPLLPLVAFGPADAASDRSAARSMCQGERATIVGANRQRGLLVGTPGRDVVVTAGARSVTTGGGDDLVCVTGRGRVSISTSEGDDRVVVQGKARRTVRVDLGAGADFFRGGRGADHVVPDGPVRANVPDVSRDVIRTGPGNDTVMADQSTTGLLDDIDLGRGDDRVTLPVEGMASTGRIAGGSGVDAIVTWGNHPVRDELRIDNRLGTIERDGAPWFRVRGVESFSLGPASTSWFRGTDADETFLTGGDVDVDMGGGDDHVQVGETTGRVAGGLGRDSVLVWANEHATVDLISGVSTTGQGDLSLAGIEDADAWAEHSVTVRGNDGPNRLRGSACGTIRLDGRQGDDRLSVGGGEVVCDGDPLAGATLVGGPDNDVLVGNVGRDTVFGGPGRDRADGERGRDRCVAEREVRCER